MPQLLTRYASHIEYVTPLMMLLAIEVWLLTRHFNSSGKNKPIIVTSMSTWGLRVLILYAVVFSDVFCMIVSLWGDDFGRTAVALSLSGCVALLVPYVFSRLRDRKLRAGSDLPFACLETFAPSAARLHAKRGT